VNYWWIAASLPLQIISHYFRALRWVTLMKPIQAGMSVWNSFSGVMVGYMLNNVVPRSGEVARPLLLSRREHIRFSTAIATILVERVLDVLSLCVFVLIMFAQLQTRFAIAFPNVSEQLGKALIVPLVGLIGGIILLLTTNIGEWGLRVSIKRFSEPLYIKLHGYLEAFTNGFSIFKSPGLWWRVVLETVPIWIAYSVPMYLAFLAFGFDTRYGLTFLDANVMFTITTIAYLIAPTPGAFGFYHTFAQIGLVSLYGVQNEDAVAFAFVSHGVGYISQLIIGGMFLIYEQSRGFNLRSVREVEDAENADGAEAAASVLTK
jgi:glycosyltransferase 2 family protein